MAPLTIREPTGKLTHVHGSTNKAATDYTKGRPEMGGL